MALEARSASPGTRPPGDDRLSAFLRGRAGRIAVVRGEPGSGRERSITTAASRTPCAGLPLAVLHLDLEGFEVDESSLAGLVFARACSAGERSWLAGAAPKMANRLRGGPASYWRAAAVASALAEGPQGTRAVDLLTDTLDGERALLAMVQALAARKAPLLVVREAELLPRPFLETLLALAGPPELRYALLCGSDSPPESLADVCAEPPVDLVPAPAAGGPLLERGTSDPSAPLVVGSKLHEVALAIALCGGVAPIEPLIAVLGLSRAEGEELIDQVDRRLATESATSPRLLVDHEFRHPSFRGHATYQLSDRRTAAALLDRIPPEELRERAECLLATVDAILPGDSRGQCRLRLSLARFAGRPSDVAQCRAELAWWTGPTEERALSEWIADRLADGGERADRALRVVETARGHWPPYRSQAVLSVLVRPTAGLDPVRLGDAYSLQSELLEAGSRPAAALIACDRAAAAYLAAGDGGRQGAACTGLRAASLLHGMGEFDSARNRLEQAAALCREPGEPDEELLAAILESLGNVLLELDDRAAAEQTLGEALAGYSRLGDSHSSRIAAICQSMANLEQARGDLRSARKYLGRALAIVRRAAGATSEDVGALLGRQVDLGKASGDALAALEALEDLLEVRRAHCGETGQEVLAGHREAADLAQELGLWGRAREHLERGLAIAEPLGLPDEDRCVLLKNLADVLRRSGDLRGSEKPMRQALEIDRRRLGRRHPTLVIDLYVLARATQAAGDTHQARRLLHEAAEIAEEVSPPLDEALQRVRAALDELGEAESEPATARGSAPANSVN